MNYHAVSKQSSIILRVIHSAAPPADTDELAFYPAPRNQVNQYLARLNHDAPVSIYSILPPPVIPDVLPLTSKLEEDLREYVANNHRWESVERMAYKWRVSEQTISDMLADTDYEEETRVK
ncbi:hypothetical protein K3F44_19020 [Pseudomonas sp. S07E 245]|uniref:hypothetical protein n=1 Tax=Pseudomonas sp. S07E 245 TaxID=2866278 RepID=UPI001C72DE36|nr:hypothetical protein [Pseudomonas sp. S07E 245]QYX51678.1 hypothetical protein K3F44_19020 [Pseudomonas sp. S07E 245]